MPCSSAFVGMRYPSGQGCDSGVCHKPLSEDESQSLKPPAINLSLLTSLFASVEARERPRHGGKSGGRESGIASPLVKTADTAVPVDPEIGRRRTQVAVHPLQAVKGYIASRGTVPGNRSGDIAAQRPLLDGAHSNGQLNSLLLPSSLTV